MMNTKRSHDYQTQERLGALFDDSVRLVFDETGSPYEAKESKYEHQINNFEILSRCMLDKVKYLLPVDVLANDQNSFTFRYHNPVAFLLSRLPPESNKQSSSLPTIKIENPDEPSEEMDHHMDDCQQDRKSQHVHLAEKQPYLRRKCPIWVLFWLVLMLSSIYRPLWCLKKHWRLSSLIDQWETHVRLGANRTDKCALPQDIYYRNEATHRELTETGNSLARAGLNLVPGNAMSPVLLSTFAYPIATLMLAYFVSLFKDYVFECPITVYLSNPLFVDDWVQRRSRNIINWILGLRRNQLIKASILSDLRFTPDRKSHLFESRNRCELNRKRPLAGRGSLNIITGLNYKDTCNRKRLQEVPERRAVSKPSMGPTASRKDSHPADIHQLNALGLSPEHLTFEPACFSPSVRHLYLWIRFLALIVCSLTWLWLTLLGLYFLLKEELRIRLDVRLDLLACQDWNRDATLIKDPSLGLVQMADLTSQYRKLLLSYRMGNEAIWFSCYIHEVGLMINRHSIMFWLPNYICVNIIGLWLSFDLCFVLDGFLFKWIWASQVQRQLVACNRALTIFKEKLLPVHANTNNKAEDLIGQQIALRRSNQLEAALIITYTNFELFRERQRDYRPIFEYFCYVTWTGVLSITVLMYTTFHRLGSKGAIFLIGVVLMTILVCNFFYLCCLMITHKYQRINYLLNELVGKLSNRKFSSQHEYLLKILQRQIVSNSDILNRYSTNFAGIQLTRSSIISLNSYVIGAITYLVMSRDHSCRAWLTRDCTNAR